MWRQIHFPILGILGNNLVEFGVAVLLREASEVHLVDLIRLELEEGDGGRIVNRLVCRFQRHRNKCDWPGGAGLKPLF